MELLYCWVSNGRGLSWGQSEESCPVRVQICRTFRWAQSGKHSGWGPPVFLVSSPWHRFTLPGQLSSAWQNQNSLAKVCSLKVVSVGDAASALQRKNSFFLWPQVYCWVRLRRGCCEPERICRLAIESNSKIPFFRGFGYSSFYVPIHAWILHVLLYKIWKIIKRPCFPVFFLVLLKYGVGQYLY